MAASSATIQSRASASVGNKDSQSDHRNTDATDVNSERIGTFEELLASDPKAVKSIRVLSNEEANLLNMPAVSKKIQ